MPTAQATRQPDSPEDIAASWNARLRGTGLTVVGGGSRGPFTLIADRLDRDALERAIGALSGRDEGRPAPVIPASLPRPLPAPGPRPALTHKQERVLRVVEGAVRDRGYPPSLREIVAGVGLGENSLQAARQHLVALERKGYLVVDRHVSWGIRLASPAGGARP